MIHWIHLIFQARATRARSEATSVSQPCFRGKVMWWRCSHGKSSISFNDKLAMIWFFCFAKQAWFISSQDDAASGSVGWVPQGLMESSSGDEGIQQTFTQWDKGLLRDRLDSKILHLLSAVLSRTRKLAKLPRCPGAEVWQMFTESTQRGGFVMRVGFKEMSWWSQFHLLFAGNRWLVIYVCGDESMLCGCRCLFFI